VRIWRKKDAAMLGFLFGFNARLGRMHYFLATIGLAVVMTAICFAIAFYVLPGTPRAMLSRAALMTAWPTIAAMVFFGWATLTLQAMRIRDIGWDPVCVIPAWITIVLVDNVVAGRIPAWSLGHDHQGTAVGALVNLVLFLALMFWPGGDYDSSNSGRAPSQPDRSGQKRDATSLTEARIARATGTSAAFR
jgi:uncharacterized membrane protein YhaH (DUF805 family)